MSLTGVRRAGLFNRIYRLTPFEMQPRAVSPVPLVAKVEEEDDGS
jgi:hypothetical protein